MEFSRRKVALFAAVLVAGSAFVAAGCKKDETADAGQTSPTTASAPAAGASTAVPPDVQQKVDAYAKESQSRNAANAEARRKAMEAHGMK